MGLDELIEQAEAYMKERLEDEPASEALLQEVVKSTVPIRDHELVEILQQDYLRLMHFKVQNSTQTSLAMVITQTLSDFLAERLRYRVIYKDRLN